MKKSGSSLISQAELPAPIEETGDHDNAVAVHLRSPRLNRFLDLPRPFPEKPLRVSVGVVGDSSARPVVMFLGLGCVRYLIALYDDLAHSFGLRLICIDRWGIGRTDNVVQAMGNPAEWAQVIERVVQEIGVDEFQIIAHSAGAPYACAAAIQLRERVRGRLQLLAPWVGSSIDGGE